MDGLRSFIRADNRNAVDVGHVPKPNFTETFPEAAIREGTDDEVATLRTFINTDHIEFERWGPPLVDADQKASRQAIYEGIEGEEWE